MSCVFLHCFLNLYIFCPPDLCSGSAGAQKLPPLSSVDKKNQAIAEAAVENYLPHDRTKNYFRGAWSRRILPAPAEAAR
jgi:hypothetical protein